MSHQPMLTAALFNSQPSVRDQVTTAELYFTSFLVEHNIPHAASDHFTELCKRMFPDSNIAKEYASGRTKTTAIVTRALAPAADKSVTDAYKSAAFSKLCDGGNDRMHKKYFGKMVRYWDTSLGAAVCRFLAMPVCNIATAETLFNALQQGLEKRSIPWSNVVGYASDSASVMVGKRNSVVSRILEKQPKVYSLAYVCHLAVLGAAAGLEVLPISIDMLLVDIFYHFKHSSKRWQEFSDVLADFEDIAPMRVLKHCTTRWLSLERATTQLLALWPALHTYFDREAETGNERMKRIAELLGRAETKLYVNFVSFALKPLNAFNMAFQCRPMSTHY
eukprot:scpid92565/ scgid17493/ Zinc finger protein 862